MPGDVTGSLVYDAARPSSRSAQGPVFTNLLLADEINRTPAEDPGRRCSRRWRSARCRSTARPRRCPTRSSSPRRRTRSSTRAPTRCPRRSSTASCSSSTLPLPSREDEVAVLRRHAAGFDPRDLAAAGRAAGRRAATTSRPARRGRAPVAVAPEVLGVRRRPRAGPPAQLAVAVARRLARAARPRCCRRPGVGLAVRPRLRDARRRQGAGPADAAPPRRAAARGRARGRRPPTACSTACSAPSRSPAEPTADVDRGADRDGRRCSRCSACCRSVVLPVAAGRCWSCVAAARRRGRRRPRAGRRRVAARCGSPRSGDTACGSARRPRSTLLVANAGPRAAARACCATPGCRRPARAGQRHRLDVPRRRAAPVLTTVLAPTRRGDRLADRVTVRVGRTAGARAPARRSHGRAVARCACCRRSPSRKHLPARLAAAARARRARRRSGSAGRAPSSTRCATTSRATTSARSTGGPPRAASATSSCAPGGPSATAGCVLVLDTGAHLRRPGRRRAAAGRRDGRRPAARRPRLAGRRPRRPARL